MPRSRAPTSNAQRVRGGLLEKQDDLLAGEPLVLNAVVLHALELGGKVKEIVDLVRSEVQKSKEASAANVDTHVYFLLKV